jgi:hypothetical protein
MTEQPDLMARDQDKSSTVGTSGTQDKARNRDDIDTGDLAKVEATSVEKISEGCGNKTDKSQR